jgi:hypothetical protein
VYAVLSTKNAKLHVVGAWLPPGRSTFRPTGSLPADGRGRGLSLSAVLIALAGAGVSLRARTRVPVLRAMVAVARRVRREQARLAIALLLLVPLGLLLSAWVSSTRVAVALEVGSGLVGGAEVQARHGAGDWHGCGYSPLHGAYRCPGPLLVQDSAADLLLDAPPSYPFAVPAVVLATSARAADVRVRLTSRWVGEYWAQTSGAPVKLVIDGGPSRQLDGVQRTLRFEPAERARELVLETSLGPWQTLKIALVRRDRLDPDRGYPMAPDASPFR